MRAQHLRQLIADNLDHLLRWRKRSQHFLAHRFHFDVFNKLLDHLEMHVRFQQRHANLAQSFFHIGGRKLTLAAHIFEDTLKLV